MKILRPNWIRYTLSKVRRDINHELDWMEDNIKHLDAKEYEIFHEYLLNNKTLVSEYMDLSTKLYLSRKKTRVQKTK